MLKKMRKSEKGFTLIELIIVIAILGILAMILLPKFTGFVGTAGEKSVLSEAKNIDTAIQALKASPNEDGSEKTIDEATVWKYLGKTKPTNSSLVVTGENFKYTNQVRGKTYEATKNGDSLTCTEKAAASKTNG